MDGKSESELFDTNFCRCRIVESVGEGVTDMKEGDHVVPIFNGECGDCIYCKREKTNMCERSGVNPFKTVMVNDGKSRFSTKDGKPIFHFLNTSTFSEYTVLESACVVKVEPEVPLKKMTLLSCGVSTGKDLLIACMYILALIVVVTFPGLATTASHMKFQLFKLGKLRPPAYRYFFVLFSRTKPGVSSLEDGDAEFLLRLKRNFWSIAVRKIPKINTLFFNVFCNSDL